MMTGGQMADCLERSSSKGYRFAASCMGDEG